MSLRYILGPKWMLLIKYVKLDRQDKKTCREGIKWMWDTQSKLSILAPTRQNRIMYCWCHSKRSKRAYRKVTQHVSLKKRLHFKIKFLIQWDLNAKHYLHKHFHLVRNTEDSLLRRIVERLSFVQLHLKTYAVDWLSAQTRFRIWDFLGFSVCAVELQKEQNTKNNN